MTLSDSQSPFPPESNPTSQAESASTPALVPQFPPPSLPRPQESFPEDIRTPWGGGEIILFLAFALASVFAMEIFLATFMSVHYHMTAAELIKRFSTDTPLAVSFQAAWYVVIFAFLFIMIRIYHGAPFWNALQWRRFQPRNMAIAAQYFSSIVAGIGLAVLVSVGSQVAGQPKEEVPFEKLFSTRTDVLWLMAFGILVAPLVEETLFRGFLYPVFARKWGIPAGIVITGVLFGGMHAAQLWPAFAQIGLLIIVGIVLTFARARARSVLASYLMHVSYNTSLFSGFLVSTHALKHIPPIH